MGLKWTDQMFVISSSVLEVMYYLCICGAVYRVYCLFMFILHRMMTDIRLACHSRALHDWVIYLQSVYWSLALMTFQGIIWLDWTDLKANRERGRFPHDGFQNLFFCHPKLLIRMSSTCKVLQTQQIRWPRFHVPFGCPLLQGAYWPALVIPDPVRRLLCRISEVYALSDIGFGALCMLFKHGFWAPNAAL